MPTYKEVTSDLTVEDTEINDDEELRFHEKRSKEILKAERRRRKCELREIRRMYRRGDAEAEKRKKKRTTTKILMYFILLNCTIIEAYSMIVMYFLKDLSALYSLIGAVVGESVSYAIYCCKSFNDTKEEKRIALERDQWEEELAGREVESEDDEGEDPIPDDDDHSGDIPEGEGQ